MGAGVQPSVVWIKNLAKSRKCSHFLESFRSRDKETAVPEAFTFPFTFLTPPFE